MPTPHPATLDDDALLADCQAHRSRTSGPGGQHRNKVETAVDLLHEPTGVTGAASERRSQIENKRIALFRLRVNLALEVRTDAAPGKYPSALWQSRCRKGKIAVNPRHRDFPAILAEALDVLAYRDHDPKSAALLLDCSTSQLIKLLKLDPRALEQVNTHRDRPLK